MAPLPPRLEDPIFRGPLLEATREAVLLRVPTVGRFLVGADGHSIVEPTPGAGEAPNGRGWEQTAASGRQRT
ncbi:MAG: hypothetical protein QOI19_2114 [Thermoleophilaceae bacterium]|nr:hypothetical protein [Thermoleophilaceae bacterium]